MLTIDPQAPAVTATPERKAYYARLAGEAFAPLWEVLRAISPREPRVTLAARTWRWSTLRALLHEAGGLLTTDEALRRALVLENPTAACHSRTTNTLTAAVQLVRAGEIAPAHRHTQLAVRFVLESDGGFTTVDGERTNMAPGDFVITPSWAYHHHGNYGPADLVFPRRDRRTDRRVLRQRVFRAAPRPGAGASSGRSASLATYGSGLLPLVPQSPYGLVSPVFNYPYARTRDALLAAARNAGADRA